MSAYKGSGLFRPFHPPLASLRRLSRSAKAVSTSDPHWLQRNGVPLCPYQPRWTGE